MTIDFDKIHQRPAHADGHTVIAYKKDGAGLITAGADAIVRVFDTAKSQRSKPGENISEHAEGVFSVAVHNDTFATAGEDGAVSIYRCNNNHFEKYLVRSTVPVRWLSYSANGAKIAVAADEEIIRIVLVRDITSIVQLVGHTKSVKCVAFDPVGDYLISSGCEGDVRIWDTNSVSGAPQCVKTLSGAIRSTLADSHLLGTIAWKPDGSCIALPGTNNDICIYQRHLWTKSFSLENGHTDDVITFAWSPNGRYLCSSGADKQLIIWDMKTRKILSKYGSTDEVSGISWHPKENQLAFVDRHGQLSVWDDPIDVSLPGAQHPASAVSNVDSELDRLLAGDMGVNPATPKPQQHQQQSKEKSRRLAQKSMVMDEAEDDLTQGQEVEDVGEDLEDPDIDMFSDRDDFVIDDDGAGYAEGFTTQDDGADAVTHQGRYPTAVSRGPQYKITPHPCIQPGATEFRHMDVSDSSKPREGERRYMAFSMFGIVYTIFQDTHSVVNVEFHDQSSNRNFHFTDYNNYTLASIGENGVVFGVEGGENKTTDEENEDASTASIIYYRPLNNWADSSEWTVRLPEGEDVQSVAINDGYVIAATSAGYVRIFTITGIQTHLFKLENIVAIAGGGNLAMFVYSVGTSFNGEHNLEFMIMETDTRNILQKDKLPLQKGAELTWVGFSDSMQAAMYDSNDVLSVLYQQRKMNRSTWVPVFDGKIVASQKGRKERYWPIGILRDKLMCLVLKKSNEEPYFPRPPVSDIELQMPTLNTDTEVGRLEEAHLRELVISTHERDEAVASGLEDELYAELRKAEIDMDKTLLQLIRLACRADKHQRALDLTHALHLTKSVDGAIKIASHHGMASLAEKMMQVKEDKLAAESGGSKRRADGEVEDLLVSSKRLRL